MTDTTGARVLIVDDDAASRRMLEVRMRTLGCEVATAVDGQDALAAVEKQAPSLMLLDLQMPRIDGIELLRTLRQAGTDFPVIVVTAHGSIETAVEAMREGAYDFLPKPIDPKHLEIVVRKALEREALRREVEVLVEETDKRYRLVVGESPGMKEAVEVAKKAAASNATVLLLGESGTGKEIFARAIHSWSERQRKPFVAINCVGLSRELLESELFGHERGAFTGAHELEEGQAGDGSWRHGVSRRGRRHRSRPSDQAAAISPGAGIRPGRRPKADQRGCAGHCRDQSRSGPGGEGRPLP